MMETKNKRRDEFYVGYLALPWGHSGFLRVAVPLTLWVLVFVSIGVAWTQRDPGRAVWDDGMESTWTGVVRSLPYPMLEIEYGEGAGSVALLVEQGKHGGGERCARFDGARVRMRGWRLERDGRRIIELSPEADAIERGSMEPVPAKPSYPESLDPVTLRGEIMDAKCFLGAMKPGEGTAHKSCAILCLTGGIPPMLVARDAGGAASYYLVTDENGGAMPEELIALAGEPVTVTGVRKRLGDLEVVMVRTDDVARE